MGIVGRSFQARRFEIGRYLTDLSGSARGRLFALISQYRSGSTLLRRLLHAHPEVRCEGEIFLRFLDARPRTVLFPTAFVRAGATGSSHPVCGSVLRIDQLEKCLHRPLHGDPGAFIGRLADKGWTFVHLRRRNALMQALSNVVAHERKRWHRTEGDEGPQMIRVDCDRLVEWTRWNEDILAQEESILAPLTHLTLTYEDDLLLAERHQATADRSFRFLGVPSHPVAAPLRRTGAGGLIERVRNYEEVIRRVRSAGLDHYLDE